MLSLLCPKCGQEINAAGLLSDELATCTGCGLSVAVQGLTRRGTPGPPTAPEICTVDMPVPDETLLPRQLTRNRDTITADRAAADAAMRFDFLAPARSAREIGWLGPYRVRRLLGEGGMGLVFDAEDTSLRRPVALKVLRPEIARDTTARQRFVREAQAMAAVRSDHVVTVHQVGEEAGLPYLAMELLEGETLETRLRREPRLPVPEVLRLGEEIARGLTAAHSRDLVHRDVKPSNIWLETPTDRVKLLDFGLARPTGGDVNVTRTGMIVGTPAYMAPEQAEAGPIGAQTDLFSLGCVLYLLATGQTPFPGSSPISVLKAVLIQDPRPPLDLDPLLPPGLNHLILRLLEKEATHRPASAAEVGDTLRALATGRGGDVPLATASAGPARFGGRRRVLVLAGALLLVTGAVTGLLRRGSTRHADPSPPRGVASAVALATGMSADRILLGMTGPFSGPTEKLGRGVKLGIETALEAANTDGGVSGRRLELTALDDGYEPERTLQNVRTLREQVFALIGNVGTPTAEYALPYIVGNKVFLFGPFTGANFLRNEPPDPYVFNYRASYAEETQAIVKHLVHKHLARTEEIAVFAQADSFGESGLKGVTLAIRGLQGDPDRMLCVRFQRNTTDMRDAVQQVLHRPGVRAVVMIAPYGPAARFIQQIRKAGFRGAFANVSFVGSEALGQELTQAGPGYAEGVIITQVVPPIDSAAAAVALYRERLKRYHPEEQPSYASLEGYITATLLIRGLRQAGDNPTPQSLATALETRIKDLDLGIGTPLRFGPSEHQASHKVWGTYLDSKGRALPLELE